MMLPPPCLRKCGIGARHAPDDIAGIVDEAVEATELLHGCSHDPLTSADLREIGWHCDRLPASVLDIGDDRLPAGLTAEIVDNDAGPLAAESARHRGAN